VWAAARKYNRRRCVRNRSARYLGDEHRLCGSSTDSGHIGGDCIFALQPTPTRLNVGRLNDFIVDSLLAQVRWAKAIAGTYYGLAPARNYWDGCSNRRSPGLRARSEISRRARRLARRRSGGELRPLPHRADLGPIAMEGAHGRADFPAKTAQATLSAITACDAADGVMDGVIGEPRSCKFSAKANVCGEPTAPAANCLTPQEAAAIDLIWDGPRNTYGKQVFPASSAARRSRAERRGALADRDRPAALEPLRRELRLEHADAGRLRPRSAARLDDDRRHHHTNDPRLERVRDGRQEDPDVAGHGGSADHRGKRARVLHPHRGAFRRRHAGVLGACSPGSATSGLLASRIARRAGATAESGEHVPADGELVENGVAPRPWPTSAAGAPACSARSRSRRSTKGRR